MTDLMEMFRHWNAGRSQVQIYEALNIDRKTIRKYLAPALAEGLGPAPDDVFDDELWRTRIQRWFPDCVAPWGLVRSMPLRKQFTTHGSVQTSHLICLNRLRGVHCSRRSATEALWTADNDSRRPDCGSSNKT